MKRIVGIMTVRNEEDIVAQCLEYACKFHEVILIADCGSDDKTVHIVKSMANKMPQIIFLGEVGTKHSRQIKRHIWFKFRKEFSHEIWWSVVDADEFLDGDPQSVVDAADCEFSDHIFSKTANFYFTELDAENWRMGKESIADRIKPIEERRRFYRMHTSQIRMFRNLPWLRWNEDVHHPTFLAKSATERLVYRHYQYRDPLQIEKRIQTRRDWLTNAAVMKDNPHWGKERWTEAVSLSSDSSLKMAIPGLPLEVDPELPTPNRSQQLWKTAMKYSYALWLGFKTKQQFSDLFDDTQNFSIKKNLLSSIHD